MTRSTNRLLTAILVLQSLILLGQWSSPRLISPAEGQIPDGGALKIQTVDELKNVNARLDRLIELLESGKLQVHVAGDEKR